MLHLVLGPAGSGKSAFCLDMITKRANAQKASVLVVPEQSSFSFEREFTVRLDPALLRYVEIRSFRKLCSDVFSEVGGGARERLSGAEKSVLVRRALARLGDKIQYYRRHVRDRAFCAMTASLIDELKNGGVDPDALRSVCSQTSGVSQAKLAEIAEIFCEYETLLRERFTDEASELSDAAELCEKTRCFDDKAVFFDGYSGFTEPELRFIAALCGRAKELFCTLCCEQLSAEQEESCFSVSAATGRRLQSLCGGADLTFLTTAYRFEAAGLLCAERFFSQCEFPSPSNEGIYSVTGEDIYDESRKIAAECGYLLREKHLRPSDIVVITRDTSRYKAPLEQAFKRCGVPCYCDDRRSVLYSRVTVFLSCALTLARRFTSEALLALLKTGLCGLDEESVGELENYVFVHDVSGADWYEPFTANPDGFGEAAGDSQLEALARIERSRAEVMRWLPSFLNDVRGKRGTAVIDGCYSLLERCGALDILAQCSDDQRRQASASLKALERLRSSTFNDDIDAAELCELLALIADETTLGDIPPALEQVTITGAQRARTNNPAAVFVCGLNEGLFPREEGDADMLNSAERQLLEDNGAQLSRSFVNSTRMEELYVYRAVSAARQRLYLCSSARDLGGAGLSVSSMTAAFLQTVGANEPDFLAFPLPFCTTRVTALGEFARALQAHDLQSAATIRGSLGCELCDAVVRAADEPELSVSERAVMLRLLGDSTAVSPSKAEAYARCPFSYFMRYVLHIKPIRKAQLDPLEAGSFVHYIMENTLRTLGGDISEADDDTLREQAQRHSLDYLNDCVGERELARQPRLRYLAKRLCAQSVILLIHLRDEQRQSDFRPCEYELSIGRSGETPALELATNTGERVFVEGKIDRVDCFERDGVRYIRVVDYKTGNKKFSLRDVYYGLNMQMLVYLFSLCSLERSKYAGALPAGVLYVPCDPSPVSAANEELARSDARRSYRMDGLLLDEPNVVRAMERDAAGVYLPIALKSDDTLASRSADKLASLEKLGRIRGHIEKTISEMASALYEGRTPALPIREGQRLQCDFCEYASVCRRDRCGAVRELPADITPFADEEDNGEKGQVTDNE